MRKYILFILLLIIAELSFSQQTESISGMTSGDYLKKSKHLNSIGLALVLGGPACVIFGSIAIALITKNAGVIPVVEVIGLVAIPVSVPFFIAAHQNKKKALSLSFKPENVPQLKNGSLTKQSIPSVSLSIRL